jgi:hypothetical protein
MFGNLLLGQKKTSRVLKGRLEQEDPMMTEEEKQLAVDTYSLNPRKLFICSNDSKFKGEIQMMIPFGQKARATSANAQFYLVTRERYFVPLKPNKTLQEIIAHPDSTFYVDQTDLFEQDGTVEIKKFFTGPDSESEFEATCLL